MKKTHAVNLTGKIFSFRDDSFFEDDGFRFYNWKAKELCRVIGVIELEQGNPMVCVGVGRELFDFEHIACSDFEKLVDVTRDFSTALATADRPHDNVINFTVSPAGTNHARS